MAIKQIIPHLIVSGGPAAVRFYQEALGAVVMNMMLTPDGQKLMHAAMNLGGAHFFVCDEFPDLQGGVKRSPTSLGGSSLTLHIDVADCDEAMQRFAAAGGTISLAPMDAFWGDRYGKGIDPFGHEWSFGSPLSVERAEAAAKAWAEFQKSPG